MAAKIPAAKKVVIPAAGHAVNIDQPQAFIDAVLPFLDGLDAQAARKGRIMTGDCRSSTVDGCPRRACNWSGYRRAPPPGVGPYSPPFTATLSNNLPLAFGMDWKMPRVLSRRH